MAIEFFTGFEGCTSTSNMNSLFDYANDTYYYSSGGFENSKCFRTSYSGSFRKNTTASKTKAIGCHLKSTEDNNDYILMGVILSDGSKINVRNSSSGINVYRDSTIIASCLDYIDSSMHHFEWEVFSNDTTGYVIVKLDGEEIINETGLNTNGSDIVTVEKTWSSSSQIMDNFYIADELQGEIYSHLLKPNSDIYADFTRSEGDVGYLLLQENDGDSTYVQSETIGDKDLYGYEDLPVGFVPLSATVVTNARRVGTGKKYLQGISKYNEVEYNDTDPHLLSMEYPDGTNNQPIIKVHSTAQDGTELTREKLNSMEFGFKVAAEPV